MLTASTRKITISLPTELVAFADGEAERRHVSRSRMIAEALARMAAETLDQQAAEGYAFYAEEAAEFAESGSAAVAEAIGQDRLRPIGRLGVEALVKVDQALRFSLGLT